MSKQTTKVTNSRFIELDSLRGIAAMLVLLSHYTWAYDYHFKTLDEHLFHFAYGGDFGVQIFFMISGFVIFMTLDKSDNVRHFAISRFSRLYPTYWVSILITALVIMAFPVPTLGNYSLGEIIMNFTMIQGFFKIRHIDQVYWSLAIELLFYIIMGIVFYKKQLHKIELFSILWLAIVIITLLADFPLEKYIRVLLIVNWAPLFIAGMMFYKIKYKNSNYVNHVIIGLSFVVFMVSLYLRLTARDQVEISVVRFLLIILAFLVFYLLMYFDIRFLRNKYLVFFGFISYPLYLLHNVIGYSIIYRVKMIYDSQIFYVPVATLITVFLAYLVAISLEKPSKWIRNWLELMFNNIGSKKYNMENNNG